MIMEAIKKQYSLPSAPRSRNTRWFMGIVAVVVILYIAVNTWNYGMSLTPQQPISSPRSSPSSPNSSVSDLSRALSSSLSSSRTKRQKQILLITKGRSGSSYTGALISDHPSVFYTFEPFHGVKGNDYKSKNTTLRHKKLLNVLGFYLRCDVTNMSPRDMDLKFHKRTDHGHSFLKCQKENEKDGFSHIECLLEFLKTCRSRDFTFAKVIRVAMRDAQELLDLMPDLKIIYLVRDPRATMYSQMLNFQHVEQWRDSNLNYKVPKYCVGLVSAFKEIARLRPLYPDRIRVARYEDGADKPIDYAKDIYKFIGLNFTKETMSFIRQTRDSQRKEGAFGIVRSNVTQVMNKWRQAPESFKVSQMIDELCGEVYPQIGYYKVKSVEHLLSGEPLYNSSIDFEFLNP